MTSPSMQDIINLCHAVMVYQRHQNWQLKAMPVLAWEFANIGDFMDARATLEQAVRIARSYDTIMPSPSGVGRMLSPHTVEIDCCGITFRLTCVAIYDTMHGPVGAAEMKPGPSFRDLFGPPSP